MGDISKLAFRYYIFMLGGLLYQVNTETNVIKYLYTAAFLLIGYKAMS